jgi:3-hydroxy-3-methylglutaryl CoA synthase
MGWLNPATLLPGEKAVANYDEDSVTMAVAAGMNCLNGFDRDEVNGLYLATTTSPYKERQIAGIVATALNLRSDIQVADFANSTTAGTSAFISACNALKAGSVENIMLCTSDCRIGKPGSAQEELYGDGAAAFLMGSSNVIASLEGSYSMAYDFMGHWRSEADKFDRTWEDRFIRDEGYNKFVSQAISGLLSKYNLDIKDFAKIVYPCLYIRDHANIGKKLGAEPDQIQEQILTTVGDTGTACPLMMLVAALEEAKPGDKILVASFGNGSDALFLQVTDEIERIRENRRSVKKYLTSGENLSSYEKYTILRNVIPFEGGLRSTEIPLPEVSGAWRDRKTVLALCGSRCKRCGTPQFPPQRVCVNPGCGAVDEMEPYCFSDKKGKLFTYTGDNLAFSINPPAIYGMLDFDGGGRYWFDLTDCTLEALKLDMPVEMSFRRKYTDERNGIYAYFWKAKPIQM